MGTGSPVKSHISPAHIMKLIGSLALLLLAASTAGAQTLGFGWFATVGGGLAAHDNGAFSDRLKSYTPVRASGENFIYQTEDFSSAGTTLDAGLGLLFGESYIVGASGQQVGYPAVRSINGPESARDIYSLSGQAIGLDLGYAAVNDAGMLIFPYLHAGYASYALDYTNNQAEPIPFFEGEPVPAGTTVTYRGGAPRLALGVGLVKLIGVDGASSTAGFAVSARVAWGMMLSRPEWHEPDNTIVNNGGLTPAYNGVTFSISIGAGGGAR
jgi:hypothetical protein